jgi:hypothetical protein
VSPSATVFVNIVVENANGESCNVVLKDFIRAGQMIPEVITAAAGEAAGMTYSALNLNNGIDTPLIRDRTGTLVPRTVVGP